MRIVFMGTPAIAAAILDRLNSRHKVLAVYTRPDAVRGRGNELVASEVKLMALDIKLPVFTPESLDNKETIEQILAYRPDVICVVAYGALLPKEILDAPKYGCLNIHASLLPAWRGAAPIERAILAGDECVGVSIMRLEEGLDTGAYCLQVSTPIASKSYDALTGEIALMGGNQLLRALDLLEADSLEWTKQDESQASYAKKIAKGEFNASLEDTCEQLWRKVRASNDAHACKISIAGKGATLYEVLPVLPEDEERILKSINESEIDLTDGYNKDLTGRVFFKAKSLYLALSDGLLEVFSIQPDAKKCMSAKEFASGLQDIKNDQLRWGIYE